MDERERLRPTRIRPSELDEGSPVARRHTDMLESPARRRWFEGGASCYSGVRGLVGALTKPSDSDG